jgi:molybdopterin synthase catalytic subunit
VATVLYFAAARERAGTAREELELAGRTVREVVEQLVALHPALGPLVPHLRVAVNQAFAGPDDAVPAGAELALIPPVAGG